VTVSCHPAPTVRLEVSAMRCQWAKSVGSRFRASRSQAHALSGLPRRRLNLCMAQSDEVLVDAQCEEAQLGAVEGSVVVDPASHLGVDCRRSRNSPGVADTTGSPPARCAFTNSVR
jgi:hypothetical protein